MGIGWEQKGCWKITGKSCEIWLSTRQHYCDRGNYLAQLESFGDFAREIDNQDGWPRYYFDFNAAKSECETWLKTRDQFCSKSEWTQWTES